MTEVKYDLTDFTKLELETAELLWTVTWDGDLPSKTARSNLVERGFVQRGGNGFNWLTTAGVELVAQIKVAKGDGNPPHWRKHFDRFGQGSKQVGVDPA